MKQQIVILNFIFNSDIFGQAVMVLIVQKSGHESLY